MQKSLLTLPEIKLIGITAQTNNRDEMNPSLAKIPVTIQNYYFNNLATRIPHREKPGITYCVYTDYESDFTGNYTYFIGEEVTSFNDTPQDLTCLTIPNQPYAKFTTATGPMPQIVIDAWQKIWKMTSQDFGSERGYLADFEIYDERTADPQHTSLDLFIGLK